ncbi:TonB-dependent receptor [Parabacteroides hominis]|uniref:TonB-dependent receptor n=1 Tax=Parabacteroides hominis TaxID=2763057 RepID=A0ABR7DLL2_9BACT|nr:TonB-dependent receptor [Parabacteroides hominis]MBC5632314.1 TonB-dependent receptor [Parabacteroides hominis]
MKNYFLPESFKEKDSGWNQIRRVMKLTTCSLLLCSCFAFAGQANSQNAKVSLNKNRVQLGEVLDEIEKQTDYLFVSNRDVDLKQKVSVRAKKQSVQDVLSTVLKNTGLTFTVEGVNIVLTRKENDAIPELQQQGKKISGKVVDRNGEPIIGVNVVEKGTTNGIITDLYGNFSLEVNPDATLVFSYIGYRSQEIKVENSLSYNVILKEDAEALEEVVVIGYGTQKKVNLTGAVEHISAKELESRPIANVSQAIQGKMPNVNITFNSGEPGGGGSINVRGLTSINGGGPLVLIDGIPGDLNRINPNDIESISVLKDAAASAIYGARGAFGVVMITTKNAKEGKTKITYSGYLASSSPISNTDFMTNGYESVMLNDEAMRRSTGNTYTRYTEEDYAELKARQFDKMEDPSRPWVVVKNVNGKDIYNYYGNYDWWNTFFTDHQLSHSHSINVTGGSEKLNYMLSGRFYSKDGILKINKDNFKSYSFRSKVSAQIFPFLKITNNTQYFDSNYLYYGMEGGANTSFINLRHHAIPAYAPLNPDGTSTYTTSKNGYSIGNGVTALLADPYNKGVRGLHELTTTTGLTFEPIKNLLFNANYTYSFYMNDNWYRSTVVQYSIQPGVLQDVPNYNKDEYKKMTSFNPKQIMDIYVSYSNTLGKHDFSIMGGINYENQKYRNLSASRKNLLSKDLNDLNLGTGDMTVGGGASQYVLFGTFFRVNYSYADRYLLEVNGRYDGTSRYEKGSRFGFFPSFSGAWRISEEQFFQPAKKIVDNLKIRASYGQLGNQLNSNSYPYISTMGMSLSNWIMNSEKTQTVSAPAPIPGNLTWEKVITKNIGVDFSLLNSRLSFTGDAYIRDTKDMLINGELLPAVFGANSPKQNAGELRTKGYEISISWKDQFKLAGKPFIYNVAFMLGDYKSKITKFNNPTNLLSTYYVGQEYGEIWGYKTDGLFRSDEEAAAYDIDQRLMGAYIYNGQGDWRGFRGGDLKFVDMNGDKVINKGKNTLDDHGDLVKIGNSQPRYNYGMNLDLNWNNIDLSLFFQGIGKRDWYPGSNSGKFWGPLSRPYNNFIPENFSSLVWTEDNKDAYFPVLRTYIAADGAGCLNSNAKNDRYLQNIGYLRLKNLMIGYTLPEQWTKKIGVQHCRFYISGENLFTWSPLVTDYIDPEEAIANEDGDLYPLSKTISVGLDITF